MTQLCCERKIIGFDFAYDRKFRIFPEPRKNCADLVQGHFLHRLRVIDIVERHQRRVANLSLDEFINVLNQNDVDQATLRDFVKVGVSWRDYVRSRFGNLTDVTEAEIDAAIGQSAVADAGIEVLLSEIIIAAPPPQAAAALATAQQISQLTSTAAFEDAARRVSALPSKTAGGRLDWLPISNYPAPLRPILLALAPGQVTAPLPITNGVALFQLRAVREAPVPAAPPATIDYAAYAVASAGPKPEDA